MSILPQLDPCEFCGALHDFLCKGVLTDYCPTTITSPTMWALVSLFQAEELYLFYNFVLFVLTQSSLYIHGLVLLRFLVWRTFQSLCWYAWIAMWYKYAVFVTCTFIQLRFIWYPNHVCKVSLSHCGFCSRREPQKHKASPHCGLCALRIIQDSLTQFCRLNCVISLM